MVTISASSPSGASRPRCSSQSRALWRTSATSRAAVSASSDTASGAIATSTRPKRPGSGADPRSHGGAGAVAHASPTASAAIASRRAAVIGAGFWPRGPISCNRRRGPGVEPGWSGKMHAAQESRFAAPPRSKRVGPIASQSRPGDRNEALPAQWLARARSGDREAFGELAIHYRPDVERLCRRLLGSVAETEDAAQESFARAHAALDGYDPARSFRRWLLAIAAHCAIDALRRRRREARLFEREPIEVGAPADPGASPLQHGLSTELRRQLLAAIEAQPDLYRAPLVLRYYADLDYGEIAEILRVSRNQVATLLFRARARLREQLETQR
ncbi:MAG: RNA polymerase sigma factor [Deltaproteobacteria bacterium]|nr:MAG: RNA polymerase sigma factor [Deltaproteobacteria bacterium]